jgi:hypothetical protein
LPSPVTKTVETANTDEFSGDSNIISDALPSGKGGSNHDEEGSHGEN